MTVTFCGHSELIDGDNKITDKIFEILKTEVKDASVNFYLGAYGNFDKLALKACERFKLTHHNTNLYFNTPYIDDTYLSARKNLMQSYDGTIFPPLERTPKKYAIIERNKWLVRQADLIIAYVNYSWGGAAKTLDYANKLHKRYINLDNYIPHI